MQPVVMRESYLTHSLISIDIQLLDWLSVTDITAIVYCLVAAAGSAGGYKSALSLHHQLTAAGLRADFNSAAACSLAPPTSYLDVRRLPPPPPPAPGLTPGLIAPPPWFL